MKSFKLFVENKDAEQLRRMGLKPNRMTISNHPQHDYDYINQAHDSAYVTGGWSGAEEDEFNAPDAATQHSDPSDFGEPGEQFHRDEERKDRINAMKPNFEDILLRKLRDASKKIGDYTMYHNFISHLEMGQRLDRADWLVVADWLEDKGIESNYMRKYALKML